MTDYRKWVLWNKICKCICWGLEILVLFAFIAMAATIGDKNQQIKRQQQIIEKYETEYGTF